MIRMIYFMVFITLKMYPAAAQCPCFGMLDYTAHTQIDQIDQFISLNNTYRIRGNDESRVRVPPTGRLFMNPSPHPDPSRTTIAFLFVWNDNFATPGCSIFYEESTDSEILSDLSNLIQCKEGNTFVAESIFSITWVNVSSTCTDMNPGPGNTFQFNLVRDANNNTFALVKYADLQTPGWVFEFIDTSIFHPFNENRTLALNSETQCCPGNLMYDISTPAANPEDAFGMLDVYPGDCSGPTGCFVCKDKKCKEEEFVKFDDGIRCQDGCQNRCMTVFKDGKSTKMTKTLSDSCKCEQLGARDPGECAQDCDRKGRYRQDCIECSEPVYQDITE